MLRVFPPVACGILLASVCELPFGYLIGALALCGICALFFRSDLYLLAVLGSFVPRMVMLAMKPELWSPANSNLSMQYINLCVILAGICLVGLFSRLELPEKDICAALDAISAPVSLFDPVFTDGGDPLTVMDQVHDTKNTELSWLEHITLREGFQRLGTREKQILRARFYDGKTQTDVAKSMHISQAQVSRLEKGAICELRKYVSVQVS